MHVIMYRSMDIIIHTIEMFQKTYTLIIDTCTHTLSDGIYSHTILQARITEKMSKI